MGGFLGIGGSSSKTDRGVQLQSFGNLSNLFNWALPLAKETASTGQSILKGGVESLGTAGNYFKKLLSGNRSDLMQAEAPAIAATTSAADASKRQLATMGTARGGGVSASNQQIDDKTRATVDNALFGVRSAAAGDLAKVGQAETQAGALDLTAGLQAGGTAEYAASDAGRLATEAKKQDAATNQALGGSIANIFLDALAMA